VTFNRLRKDLLSPEQNHRLELRRLRADLVTCYNMINGLFDIPFDTFLGWLIIAVHAVTH